MPESPTPHLGRNDPCHCGSGKKYKQCCLAKDEQKEREARAKESSAAVGEEAAAPPPVRPPKHKTEQPWRRTTQNTRGFQRHTTPRKVGGS